MEPSFPQIALLVFTDGRRSCLERTLASFGAATNTADIGQRIIINDCPEDPQFAAWVDTLGFDQHVRPTRGRRGFAGAISAGWAAIGADTTHIFHLEDDFIFVRPVDLRAMAEVLDGNPHLAQIALRRQPWNTAEHLAGGVIEVNPGAYRDCTDGHHHWLEHRQFFTTNPSLYPAAQIRNGWPSGAQSEGRFGLHLFADDTTRCAYWGRREDPPWVHHIGDRRTGTGY